MILTDRDMDVLRELESCARARYGNGWARPLDVGGRNGSHHSYTLNKLVKGGFAESKQRSGWGTGERGSKIYRITKAGEEKVSGTP